MMINPEIAELVLAGGFRTNVHDVGSGPPALLIHGSGPGVSAWANWRLVMPELAEQARVIAEAEIRRIAHETLVIHGREARVIPLASSMTLAQWIPRAQLHVYPRCGHWTQIEHARRFAELVGRFLAEAGAEEPRPLEA
jgi:pimeloyl-ACP methyl ester carboxylesterase